jgi:hypothetical protein
VPWERPVFGSKTAHIVFFLGSLDLNRIKGARKALRLAWFLKQIAIFCVFIKLVNAGITHAFLSGTRLQQAIK